MAKRILVIDDDLTSVELLHNALMSTKFYKVDKAYTAKDAHELLRKNSYDVVVTDYMMPNLTGEEIGQLVRLHSPHTQLILISAYDIATIKNRIKKVQFDHYAAKPLQYGEIRDIVSDLLSRVKCGDYAQLAPGTSTLGKKIRKLRSLTNAINCFVLRREGFLIEVAGSQAGLDIDAICALVAANFMAAVELSRLLGNENLFKSSFHEGPEFDIYTVGIDRDHLLGVIFGHDAKAGLVRYYTHQAAREAASMIGSDLVPANANFELSSDVFAEAIDDLL